MVQWWLTDDNNRPIQSRSVHNGQRREEVFPLGEQETAFQAEFFTVLQVATRKEVKIDYEKEIGIYSESQTVLKTENQN